METSLTIYIVNLTLLITLMTAGWAWSVVRKNVTIVDSLWGIGFVMITWNTFSMGDGYYGRNLLIAVLTTAWGMRLAGYLTWRTWGKLEDHRYGSWREKAGPSFWWVSLFKVFWLQAIFLWVISLVLQKAQLATTPARLTAIEIIGLLVWSIGFFFELVGDWQLARFKSDPENRGRVMDQGLWALSRHPNYFGEFLIWWGFFLVALATPDSWWTIISPVIVTLVLLKMTGIPITEKALKSRRPGYEDYIRRTSPFFPRPPKPTKKSEESQ